MSSAKKFSYVVARLWNTQNQQDKQGADNLCIYTYGSQIQHGTEEDAKHLLAYVNRQNPDENYSIYKVEFNKVD